MIPEERFKLLQQEGYLFHSCLTGGLTALRNANDSEKGNFYIAFFQLSIGLERLMKTILIVHHMAQNNLSAPTFDTLRQLGHGLRALLFHLQSLPLAPPNPLDGIDQSSVTFDIVDVLDSFARATRYFNLDTLAARRAASDPLEDYSRVVRRILTDDVAEEIVIGTVASRSALASAVSLTSVAVDPATPTQSSAEILQRMFITPALQDLAAKHAVSYVIVLINALRKMLDRCCDAAQDIDRQLGNGNCSIPYMHEFLNFACLDRSHILRKKRWP